MKKKFFFNNGVYRQQVEQFPEFTIKKLVALVKDNPDVMSYLPDVNLDNPRQVQREFLINIMATLDPNFFEKAVDKAKANRLKNKAEVVNILDCDPRLARAIDAFVNLRKTSGRTSIGMLRSSKKRKPAQRKAVEDLGMEFIMKRRKLN